VNDSASNDSIKKTAALYNSVTIPRSPITLSVVFKSTSFSKRSSGLAGYLESIILQQKTKILLNATRK